MKYAHRGLDDTPPLKQLPWEEENHKQPLHDSSKHNADQLRSKSKQVKHVTINMPKVPPPSPVSSINRSKSRSKRRKKALNQRSHECRWCKNDEVDRTNTKLPPELLIKMQPTNGIKETDYVTRHDGGNVHSSQVNNINISDEQLESRNKLTENLVKAHGALRKRHTCQKKDVIISPFKVKIDEENKVLSRSISHHLNGNGGKFRGSLSKPFTFSYLPSNKQHKSRNDPLHNEAPAVFNHQHNPVQASSKRHKTSMISSFVSVNQSRQIYEALIKDDEVSFHDAQPDSLNKATDCDDIHQTMSYSQTQVEGHDMIGTLSHSTNPSNSSKPLMVR